MTKTKTARARAKAAKAKEVVIVTKAPSTKKKNGGVTKMVSIQGSGDYRPTTSSIRRLTGHGDYKSTGSAIGSALGGTVGGLADLVGGAFKAITGMGDYRTHGPKNNSLFNGNKYPMKMGAMNAQFAGGPPSIQHRELVCPILATGLTGFTTTSFRIQPGLRGPTSLFPWLSSVAQCFQQYRMKGMILEYVSTSSEYTSAIAVGSVMMSTLYDAESDPLSTALEVDNNEFTTTDKPSNSFIHPIELGTSESQVSVRYVRSSNTVSSTSTGDERLDDVGLFQISLNGIPTSVTAGTQLGELWVTYDVEFLKPLMPDLHVGTMWKMVGSPPTAATLSAWSLVLDPRNSLPVTLNLSTSRVVMPAGYAGAYLAVFQCAWSGAGSPSFATPGNFTLASNLVPFNFFSIVGGQTAMVNAYVVGATSFNVIVAQMFVTDGKGDPNSSYFIPPQPTWSGGGNAIASLSVMAVDSDFSVDAFTLMLSGMSRKSKSIASALLSKLGGGGNLAQPVPSSSSSASAPAPLSRRDSLVDLGCLDASSLPSDKETGELGDAETVDLGALQSLVSRLGLQLSSK